MLATGSSTPSSSTMALLGATFFAAAGAGVAGAAAAAAAAAAPEDSEAAGAGAGAADSALGGVTTDFFLPPLLPFFPPVANHEIRIGTHAFVPRSAGHYCPVVRPDVAGCLSRREGMVGGRLGHPDEGIIMGM
jgi:hypothetical protein